MRYAFAVLLLSSFVFAQAKPATPPSPAAPQKPAPAKPAPPSGNASKVAPTAVVMTINGVCEKPAADGSCKTTVTRAEFEKVLTAVNPQHQTVPPGAERNIANRYAQLLALVDESKRLGLDKTPEGQDMIRFATMQAQAQLFSLRVQQMATPTDADIKKFYDENASKLQEATVRRIFIPSAGGDQQKPVPEAKMKEIADQTYQRAKAGEDFDVLEKAAFAAAGMTSPPETKMMVTPVSVPPDQAAIFDLKNGEVSQMFTEPAGFFIYKMQEKRTIPLEQVKTEIRSTLERKKMNEMMESVINKAKPELNETFFGPPQPQQRPGMPPSPSEPQ